MPTLLQGILPLLKDQVYAQPGNLDARGKFIPSGAVLGPLPCRVEAQVRLVRGSDGREVKSSAYILVGAVNGFNGLTTDRHRYTIPDDFSPNIDLRAVAVDKVRDDAGDPCYEEVMLP